MFFRYTYIKNTQKYFSKKWYTYIMKKILLCFDIPRKKNYIRTKTWRKLQKIGAELRLGSYWMLPFVNDNLKFFKEISNEIIRNGGRAEIIIGEII